MGDTANNPVAKRYRSYPASHFSRWRGWYQTLIRWCFVNPFVWFQYHPVVTGREHIPKTGPMIAVANHISLADPPVLCYAVKRPLAFMAKQELFHTWLKAEFYRSVGCFALDREHPDAAVLKTALNVLRSSGYWGLGLFPEGTRSLDGKLLPLKKGFAQLAHKAQVPIVPVGIRKDKTTGRLFVNVGPPITDVSDPDVVHEQVSQALALLTQDNLPTA